MFETSFFAYVWGMHGLHKWLFCQVFDSWLLHCPLGALPPSSLREPTFGELLSIDRSYVLYSLCPID